MATEQARHLLVISDSSEIAGAERALAELLANLDASILITVAAVNRSVGSWIAAHRTSARLQMVPPLAHKRDLRNVFALRRILRDLEPTVVHLNKTEVGGLRYMEIIARSVPGVRVVSVVHHVEEAGSRVSRSLCRFLANRRGATVAVGVSLARQLEMILGLDEGKVAAIPNALAPRTVQPEASATSESGAVFTAGALTRMVPHKRVSDIIQALALVENVHLVLGGTGPQLDDLKAQAVALGVSDRVEFPGWVDADSVLSRLDVYVLASGIEGYPIALLEAQQWGLPVIASRVGGVPEIVHHNEDGLLFSIGDVESLARHLRALRDDPGLVAKMSHAAQQSILDRPGPGAMAEAYAGLYWPDDRRYELAGSR